MKANLEGCLAGFRRTTAIRLRVRSSLLGLIAFGLSVSSARGQFLRIVPSYDSEVTPAMKVAIQGAVDRWNSWIAEPATGGAATLEVKFSIALLGVSFASTQSEWLGLSGDYALTPAQNMVLNNADSNGTGVDSSVGFNRDFLEPASFYYGTDGSTPSGKYDVMSIVMHEIGHAMGVDCSYKLGYWGYFYPAGPSYHVTLWDSHLRDEDSNRPKPWTQPNPFNRIGDVVFVGTEVQDLLARPLGVYSPPTYVSGSSLVHVDDDAGRPSLMGYSAASMNGRAIHGLWDYEVAVFEDMGWHFTTILNDSAVTTSLSGGSDYWHNGSIWGSGLPPTGATNIVLGSAPSPYTVYVTRKASAASVNVRNGARLLVNENVGLVGDLTVQHDLVTDGDVEVRRGKVSVNGELTVIGDRGAGTLKITGGTVSSGEVGVVAYHTGSGGLVTVDGTGSNWTMGKYANIGLNGDGSLIVKNGGRVSNGQGGVIGAWSGSEGLVRVEGAGSEWRMTRHINVGSGGLGTLEVLDGGSVSTGEIGAVGQDAGSRGLVTVDGTGSNWTMGKYSNIGASGDGVLIVRNGGRVSNGESGVIGYAPGSTGVATVEGPSSEWIMGTWINVGYEGNGTLSIRTGGLVSNGYGGIGYCSGASGTVNVDGSGSVWANAGRIDVGLSGVGALLVRNGGLVTSAEDCAIGNETGAHGEVTVEDAGSKWHIGTWVNVGYQGAGSLLVRNGGHVQNGHTGAIGHKVGSTGVVTVDGSGSTWTNSDSLSIGYSGQGTLNITNGGGVSNPSGYIGNQNGSTGVVTVDGSGSTWTNSDSLSIGYSGQGTLNITNGGAVSNPSGYIGNQNGSTGVVTVDGSGSAWTNSDSLSIGYSGQGTLNITNGGAVSSIQGRIGYDSTGEVRVDGGGSTWINSGGLFVGHYGRGTLHITDSGAVSSIQGRIGYDSTGEVRVDGGGSTWINSGSLFVGHYGRGTLNITHGGAASNSYGYIGNYSVATGIVTVDGSGSTWTNSRSLSIGGSHYYPGGTGIVTVQNSGLLEVVETLKVWGRGTLAIGATGQVTVGEALVLTQDSTLTADAGATIHMTGSAFENQSANPDNLAGLGNLRLVFEGGSVDIDPFEVAGEDMGALIIGLNSNFALGTLQLGGPDIGQLKLVDTFDNQPSWGGSEALYVKSLILDAGSVLDLNGLNVYYLNFTNMGGIVVPNGGSINVIPEPGTLALLTLGACLAVRRRRR